MSGQQTLAPNWQAEQVYESGKGRRYKLLFTVNGGAYVLIGFLVDKADALKLSPIGIWAFVLIPVALAYYTWLMYKDINAFGNRMHDIYPEVYKDQGRRHLWYVCWLLIAAWILAIIAIVLQWAHAF